MTLKRKTPIILTHRTYTNLRKKMQVINPQFLSEQSGVPIRRIYALRKNKSTYMSWPEFHALIIAMVQNDFLTQSEVDNVDEQ